MPILAEFFASNFWQSNNPTLLYILLSYCLTRSQPGVDLQIMGKFWWLAGKLWF